MTPSAGTVAWNTETGSHLSYDDLEAQAFSLRTQIRELQSRLAEVISQQNTLVPVGRIPNEILLGLFTLFTPSLLEDQDDKDARIVSQVCRRWRRLALSLPALWTRISLRTDPEYVRLMLARSRGGPVDFDALHDFCPGRNCELIAAEAHRMRGLALGRMPQSRPTGYSEGPKLLEAASTSPVMEELLLSGIDIRDDVWGPINRGEHVRVVVPTMRRLVLSNTVPSPNFLRPFVNTVTEFSLSGSGLAKLNASWQESLLLTLALMPRLQSLTMSDTGANAYLETVPSVTPTSLPCLSLFVADMVIPRHIAGVVPSLEVPATTRFRITTFSQNAPSRLRAPPLLQEVRSLSLALIGPVPEDVVIYGYTADTPSLGIPPKTEINLFDSMTELSTCIADLSAFTRACGDPELETCEFVDVRLSPRDEGDVRDIGTGLPACSTLRLVRCSLAVVGAVLDALGRWATKEEHEAPFCARLRRVEVCGLHDEEEGDAAVVGELLARMVDRREEMGAAPLARVVVTGMSRLSTR